MSTNEQTLMKKAEKAALALQESNPSEATALTNYIAALRNQHVACLGDNEVLQIRDQSGRLTAIKQNVSLSTSDGTLVGIPMGQGKEVVTVSAFGFKRLADAAGAVVMNAPTVIVDGVEQKNPHVERDDFGNVIAVHVRSMCFRYGATGQPQVSDRTAVFDSMTILRADLTNKAKWKKDQFKMGAPKTPPATNNNQNWIEFPLNPYVSIYADANHSEFLNLMATMSNRQKKALEITQTFAQRNAMKHLFGVDKPVDNASSLKMEVISYLPVDGGSVQFSSAKFTEAVKKVANISQGKGSETAKALEGQTGVKWECMSGTDTLETLPDMVDGMDAEDAKDIVGEGTTVQEALELDAEYAHVEDSNEQPLEDLEPEQAPTEEQIKAFSNLSVTANMFPDEYAQALADLGIQEATPFNAMDIHSRVTAIVDAE